METAEPPPGKQGALSCGALSEIPIFSSWKEIATYLAKGVRTVQRWEREHALPVRRVVNGGRKAGVVAWRTEIDAWVLARPYREMEEFAADASLVELRKVVVESQIEIFELRAQLEAFRSQAGG